ncbi:MAG: AAA family ATPase [Saprospiraceae bacterium]|nr:AAA family ATPase [Saprospiraceae bacterium]
MITRFQVSGFKNLVDIDLRLGPFTCIAGENGVGKSNIFDAVQFISYLADYPINEAIGMIRGRESSYLKFTSISDIFQRFANKVNPEISISLEMIIPEEGEDDLGQIANATYNFLKYSLRIRLGKDAAGSDHIQIIEEELVPLKKKDASKHILFRHSAKWRNKIIRGKRNVPFISTSESDGESFINLHQDGGSSGKPRPFSTSNLPRTVLSTARYASETPTVLLARREMQNWKFLQLEPSALRRPDELEKFSARVKIQSDGSNLPSTVYRLSRVIEDFGDATSLYTMLANKLSDLIEDIVEIQVDKDEKRQLLTLQVKTKDGTIFPARSLSDGTLRFLALAVLDLDQNENGLICLEEPENGIHPERVPTMISMLRNIPVDPFDIEVESNPLRQVIVNTHSPGVVAEVPEESLVYVQSTEFVRDGDRFKGTTVRALSGTWRTEKGGTREISKGKLLAYLNPSNNTLRYEDKIRDYTPTKVRSRKDLRSILQNSLFDD